MLFLTFPRDRNFEQHLEVFGFRVSEKRPEILFVFNYASERKLFFKYLNFSKKPFLIFFYKKPFFLSSKHPLCLASFSNLNEFLKLKRVKTNFPKGTRYILKKLSLFPLVEEIKQKKKNGKNKGLLKRFEDFMYYS